MLARATVNIGLKWNPPPSPEHSQLDDLKKIYIWIEGAFHCQNMLLLPSAETVSEAPGAYGVLSRNITTWCTWDRCGTGFRLEFQDGHGSAANIAWPSHRYVSAPSALDRPCLYMGKCPLRASVKACCCHHRWVQFMLGIVCKGHTPLGPWTAPQMWWHINCLELFAVLLDLRRFWMLVQGKC